MSIAYDASSTYTAGAADPGEWTHTPSGTPRGATVLIVQAASADDAPSVTYGGTSMTETPSSPRVHTSGDDRVVYAFHLGASVPTGAQTVSISGLAGDYFAAAFTQTAAADTELDDDGSAVGIGQTAVVLTTSVTTWVAIATGNDTAVVGNIGPGTVCDTEVVEYDFGVQVGGIYRASSLQGAGNVTADYAPPDTGQSVVFGVAIREVAVAATDMTMAVITGGF